ncbi:3-hydroxyacyl-CoA dehydrogenase NAD-binding domain-containing protein [Halobacteriovorax sp. YZS-1-1]|uniref:3-hydroxyacyl-CoA dehydrogenase NAD-binding domain-containing protein n=1 Tax=unclassified Halobacteriovorax TaxID=2639665 RepID=UPI00399BC131
MNINSVLVIGAGTMGRGIAQWFCQHGVRVELVDQHLEMAQASGDLIHSSWDKLHSKAKFDADEIKAFKKNLRIVDMMEHQIDHDLVIEAIVENLNIKCQVFNRLDEVMKESTIFASNTSSIPITKMAKDLSKTRRENFLGLHFFNPATIMKLVEIIETPWSKKDIAHGLYDWFERYGKKPALCKDSPGFIVNRVARNFYGESFHRLENYDKDQVEEIDRVMKNVGGFRMGPFELMDLIGIDVNYDVTQSVWASYYYEPRFRPHKIQREMVDSGRIGRKVKEGFYRYE